MYDQHTQGLEKSNAGNTMIHVTKED